MSPAAFNEYRLVKRDQASGRIVDRTVWSDGTHDVSHGDDGSLVFRTDMSEWTYVSDEPHRDIVRFFRIQRKGNEQ